MFEKIPPVDAFKKSTSFYENLNYDEPEPLPFSPRHWLGAAYMEIGAHSNALEEYKKDLTEHPHNLWALWGVKEALTKLDSSDPEIERELEAALSIADIWLPNTKL